MRSSRASGNRRRKKTDQGKSRSVLALGFVKQARRSCVMCGWWGERGVLPVSFQSIFIFITEKNDFHIRM